MEGEFIERYTFEFAGFGHSAFHDVPWDAIQVLDVSKLDGFEVREHQVVMRGKRRSQ